MPTRRVTTQVRDPRPMNQRQRHASHRRSQVKAVASSANCAASRGPSGVAAVVNRGQGVRPSRFDERNGRSGASPTSGRRTPRAHVHRTSPSAPGARQFTYLGPLVAPRPRAGFPLMLPGPVVVAVGSWAVDEAEEGAEVPLSAGESLRGAPAGGGSLTPRSGALVPDGSPATEEEAPPSVGDTDRAVFGCAGSWTPP